MIPFPSPEFDDAVAAVCHGSLAEDQARALNALLRQNPAARDEYILRVELHSRLASDRDLFAPPAAESIAVFPPPLLPRPARRRFAPALALAACLAALALGGWAFNHFSLRTGEGTTSHAVALLDRVVEADWGRGAPIPRLGGPLEPGRLRLVSGIAQIVFYSGARVVVQGPAELELVTPSQAVLRQGRLTAEVPPQAHGFRIDTPRVNVTDLGTAFGLVVRDQHTELHVFQGRVAMQSGPGAAARPLLAGAAAIWEHSALPELTNAQPAAFAALFDLPDRCLAAEAGRYRAWQSAGARMNADPALLVHYDLEHAAASRWELPNAGNLHAPACDATIVGCQWTAGRWPGKRALEFQGVSDRVRLSIPGEYPALTLAAWVSVKGLDRAINSLFMCDGFAPGTIHWSIRHDGVPGFTIVGAGPTDCQIVAGPPVLTVDQFGQWLHLAVVLDGPAKRVTQYLNGTPVGEKTLKVKPPFRLGPAELGNWNNHGFREHDPALIRNFSGALDEFCLFGRALSPVEIRALFAAGKPQSDALVQNRPGLAFPDPQQP